MRRSHLLPGGGAQVEAKPGYARRCVTSIGGADHISRRRDRRLCLGRARAFTCCARAQRLTAGRATSTSRTPGLRDAAPTAVLALLQRPAPRSLFAQTDRADRRPPRRRSAGVAYARRSMNARTYRTASGRGPRQGRDGRWVLFGVGEGVAGSLGAAEVPSSVLGASGGRWDVGRFARWSLLGLVVGGCGDCVELGEEVV